MFFIRPMTQEHSRDLSDYVQRVLEFMEQSKRVGGQLILYNMDKSKTGDTASIMYEGPMD